MNIAHSLWQKIKLLFYIKTGFGSRDRSISAESEASTAVFVPIFGLLTGSIAAFAAFLMQTIGFYTASIVAGLAILVVLGGFNHLSAGSNLFLFRRNNLAASTICIALLLLFETLAIVDIIGRSGISLVFVLLYMPVAEAIATLSAASVLREDEIASSPISAVKGWHLLLSSLLAFLLMLPRFGLVSIVYVSVSILAGSLTALAMSKANKKEMAADFAAIASNLLYLVCLMLLNRPQIYY